MRKFVFLWVLLLPLLPFLAVSAQETQAEDRWFFAYHTTDSNVVAYTLDGEIQTLLEGVEKPTTTYRVDDQTLLAYISDNKEIETTAIYLLTPNSNGAQKLEMLPDGGFYPVDFAAPLLMLAPYNYNYKLGVGSAAFVNIETGETTLLPSAVMRERINRCCMFSADATQVWYWAFNDLEGFGPPLGEHQLRVFDLNTREEQVVYSFTTLEDMQLGFIADNSQGSYWLVATTRRAGETWQDYYELITARGTVELIHEMNSLVERPNISVYGLSGNTVVRSPLVCKADCFVELTPLTSLEPLRYQLSLEYASPFSLLYFDEQTAVGTADGRMLRLFRDKAPEVLGYFDSRYLVTSPTYSSDGRYAALMFAEDDPTQAVLLNTVEGRILATMEATEQHSLSINTQFTNDVITMIDLGLVDNPTLVVVDTATDEVQSVAMGNLLPVLPLSPEQILAYGRTDTMPGIFVMDVATGESTRVVEGAYLPLEGMALESMMR